MQLSPGIGKNLIALLCRTSRGMIPLHCNGYGKISEYVAKSQMTPANFEMCFHAITQRGTNSSR